MLTDAVQEKRTVDEPALWTDGSGRLDISRPPPPPSRCPIPQPMHSPYAPPVDVKEIGAKSSPNPVGVACLSVLCGGAAHLPAIGVRGAAFCAFPGLAQRSIRRTLGGALLGFLADIGVTIFWMIFGGVWEPRWGGFNHYLAQYVPPDMMVATHVGSPLPNSLRFGLGFVLWSVTMYAIWLLLWRPRLESKQQVAISAIGAITVGLSAAILWTVAPLTEMLGAPYQPFGDLPLGPFLVVLFSTMPLCSLIVGVAIYLCSQAQTKRSKQSHGTGAPRT